MAINLAANIEHRYVAKELWEVFLNHVVLFIYHLLPNLFFDLLLSGRISRISAHESIHLFKLFFLLVHLLFHTVTYDLFEFDIIICYNSVGEFRILMQDVVKFGWFAQVMLLDPHDLTLDSLSLHVSENLVKEVLVSLTLTARWNLDRLLR